MGPVLTLLPICCPRQMPFSCPQLPQNLGSCFFCAPHLLAAPPVPQLPGEQNNNRCKMNAFSFFTALLQHPFPRFGFKGSGLLCQS